MKATAFVIIAGIASAAQATPVLVEIFGEVDFNQITPGQLGMVNAGETAHLSFMLDSTSFIDSAMFPTRGYDIDLNSLDLSFSGGTSIGANPLAPPSYFVLRDNDPAVDGFFTGGSVDGFPSGIELNQVGVFENFASSFSVTYGNDPLSSLNILDAVGTYDFTGLTVFGMTITDGPFDAMGLIFSSMTITQVPAPSTALPLVVAGLAATRRRR